MDFIFLILPLLLMEAASPIDYVKDTFAVAYIVTLDNIDDERKYYFRRPAELACWWGGYQPEAAQPNAHQPTPIQEALQCEKAGDDMDHPETIMAEA